MLNLWYAFLVFIILVNVIIAAAIASDKWLKMIMKPKKTSFDGYEDPFNMQYFQPK